MVVMLGSFMCVVDWFGLFKLLVSMVVLCLEGKMGVCFFECSMCCLCLIDVGEVLLCDVGLLF